MALDLKFSFTVPAEKVQIARDAFLEVHPNRSDVLSDEEWFRERVRSWMVDQIERGLTLKRRRAAAVARDDSVVR